MRISLLNGSTTYHLAGQAGVAESVHSSAAGVQIGATIQKQTALRVRADAAVTYDRANLQTTVSFSTVRTFATTDEAELWALDYDATYPRTGTLTMASTGDGTTRTMTGAVVDPPARDVLGCAVVLNYTVTGGAISDGAATGLVYRIAFCGDSITNGASGYQTAPASGWVAGWLATGAAGWAAAILEHAITGAVNTRPMNYAGYPDLDFGWDGITAADYLNSTTAISTFPTPDAYAGNLLTPAQAAVAEDPDAFVLHIGTNDLNTATASTTLTRITALAVYLRGTGKPVFLCTLLPRTGNTSGPTVETFQSRIDDVNAALPAIALATGCTLVSWHADLMTGGAQNAIYFSDSTHPNAAGCALMGIALAASLTAFVGDPYPIPAKGAAAWITSNPYMDVDTSPADEIADGFSAYWYTTAAHTVGDVGGTIWQTTKEQAESTTIHEFYAPSPSGATILAAAGTARQFRAVCRYEVVEGDIGGLGLLTTALDGDSATVRGASHFIPTTNTPPIEPHSGVLMTEAFTYPADAETAYARIIFYGNGTIRLRQFGIFEIL